jgi:hypothetical protein
MIPDKKTIELYKKYHTKEAFSDRQIMLDLILINMYKLGNDRNRGIGEFDLKDLRGLSKLDFLKSIKDGIQEGYILDATTHDGRAWLLSFAGKQYVEALLEEIEKPENAEIESETPLLKEPRPYIKPDSDPLDNLVNHWNVIIEKMQTQELTRKMAMTIYKDWKYAIKNYYDIQSEFSRYTKQKQWEKIEQIENLIKPGMYQALQNYRNAERIKLKELYGPMGELIYFIKKILDLLY